MKTSFVSLSRSSLRGNARSSCTKAVLLGVLSVLTLGAQAVGFRLPNQDPEAIARGNAFVATADNPSAIYYNPAGITQLPGQNVRAGLYSVSAGIEYESPTDGTATANADFKLVPELYYVVSLKDSPLSFGLGVYAPYGLSLDWGPDTPFWMVAEKGELMYMSVNPVVAWKIHPTLSIAIGPTFNYSKAKFQRGLQGIPGFLPDGRFALEGDGWDYGFNAGLRWQPHEKWAYGVNYRSATEVQYGGSAETSWPPPFAGPTSAAASIRFPQFVVAGVSFRPTEDWNLEFDLDWTDWDNVNEIVIKGTPVGDSVWPLNYRSSFMYEFGITRRLGKDYFVSVGYFFSENSSPDHDFNPAIPDSDLHLGSIGFGHKGRRWDWAVAYHFGYNPGREVKNDVSFPQANGTYHILNHAFNVAVTLKF
jgi:long-chain fatty acid transport protein